MTSHYRRSELAAVLGNYGMGIATTILEIFPMHHRMFHAHIMRNKQFLIRVLMQELEENNTPRIASVTDPK